MTRELLREASEHLETASELTEGAVADRISTQAEQIGELTERESGPDHGRLDRHMHALKEIAGDLSGEAADRVESARERLREYRTGVEGV